MINKKVKIIISLLLGIVTISGLAFSKIFAQTVINKDEAQPKPGMAGVTCYLVGPSVTIKEPRAKEIKTQIKQLDSLYAEAKINTETYNERKKQLQDQLKRIESTDDGVDENSIEDLNLGLKRIRYQYKMKKLTPEMYNDKRKFYMERIASLEEQKLEVFDRKIESSKQSLVEGKITPEQHQANVELYEQQKIYKRRHGDLHLKDPEMTELYNLKNNGEIDEDEYRKRKAAVFKRINLADSKKEKK